MRIYRPKSHLTSALSFIALILLIWYVLASQTPSSSTPNNVARTEWSTARALTHVKAMSQAPHFVGSKNHDKVRLYIEGQLKKLNLEVTNQTGYTLDNYGNLAKPTNILARIKGTRNNSKALVLLCHYDSDPHSSLGASDAASGVATILEGVRAFKATGKKPKNDIIILITDSEEIGLNGAELFVDEHPWAKNVGMVLNFEARGSGGPSYMLVETNGGNRNIINAFKDAGVTHPVANSLAYSIYKKLPNDTDLTVFRETGNINGLNFAFIDDHYDYHSALDNYDRLDRNTLAHQGAYLMPLLNHFSTIDISDSLMTRKGTDDIYFPLPLINMVSFPFAIMPYLIIISGLLLLAVIIYGMRKGRLKGKHIAIGFVPFLVTLILGFLISNFGWKAISSMDFYQDQLHGFPYNGHWLIGATIFFTLSIGFILYHRFYEIKNVSGLSIAPLFILWVICLLVAFPVGDSGLVPAAYLPGAGFFIVPLFMGIIMLAYLFKVRKPSYIVLFICCIPTIAIFVPFVIAFPVALGMKIIFVAAILTTLILGLLVPYIGHYRKKHILAGMSMLAAVICLVFAFAKAKFSPTQPQSTSLVYSVDLDTQTSQWATYDTHLSEWTTEKLGAKPQDASSINKNVIDSKYSSGFSYVANAPSINLEPLLVETLADSTSNGLRTMKIKISSKSLIQRLEVFCPADVFFENVVVNGTVAKKDPATGKPLSKRRGNRLLSYYVVNNEPLELELSFYENQKPVLQLIAASFDLLNNKELQVNKRPKNNMPMPFVLNDAILRKKRVDLQKLNVIIAPVDTLLNE